MTGVHLKVESALGRIARLARWPPAGQPHSRRSTGIDKSKRNELNFQKLLNTEPGGEPLIDLDRPLDAGEKADDAEDFEISATMICQTKSLLPAATRMMMRLVLRTMWIWEMMMMTCSRGSRYITFRRARWP